MSQEFTGQVFILNRPIPAKLPGTVDVPSKVRITLSGDAGTAQYAGGKDDTALTTVSNRHIAIGHNPRKVTTPPPTTPPPTKPSPTKPSPVAVLLLNPDEGVGGPTDWEKIDVDLRPKPITWLTVGDKALPGGLFIVDTNGTGVLRFDGVNASLAIGDKGNAGDVLVYGANGDVRLRLNGDSGDIELVGADCAEEFDVEGDATAIEPGTVMSIGDGGALRPSGCAYDRRVAGIVSGAGPYRPGIVLDKVRGQGERMPVALTGKAYCKVDATYAPVEIGDLLTTSPTLGFAMKAIDPLKAFGTVIGKALHPLPSGQGLIPILVALQ